MQSSGHLSDQALAEEVAAQDALTKVVLTRAGLFHSNPNSDVGLVFPLPQQAQISRIVLGYDSKRTTGEKVRCAACPQHQPHFRGFRVELVSGEHAQIGVNCGESHFGDGAWQVAVSDYDRRVEHANFVGRIEPALRTIERVMPLIEQWHHNTKRLAASFAEFQRSLPRLAGRLSEIAKEREGRFEREKRIRNKEVNRHGVEEVRVRVEVTTIGRIPFPGMFRGETPNHGLNGAKKAVKIAVALLTNKRDSVSLAKAFREMRQARQYLVEAAQIHRSALSNLDSGWIAALCDWASHDDNLEASYEAKGRSILHDEGGVDGSFEFPSTAEIGQPPIDQIIENWV